MERVVDGDTVDLELDLGYSRRQRDWRVRVMDVDTAEKWGVSHDSLEYERAMVHTRFVGQWMADGQLSWDGDWPFIFDSQKWETGSFNRALGYIYRRTDGEELSEALLDEFGSEVEY